MFVIFYGATGVGKNYVGKLFAETYNCKFYDADLSLTEEMKACINIKKPFTQEMRNEFFSIVIDKIKTIKKNYKNIVLVQAISQEINRKQIQEEFPNAHFCCIETSLTVQMENIRMRGNQVDEEYARSLNRIQQVASNGHFIIINNQRKNLHLTSQFVAFKHKIASSI
jgi:gluconokinase